jgi:dTDP-4-amino-4,6-dideoxygalactose transaminase
MGYGGLNLKMTETYYEQAVSIPMYPKLTEKEQDFVINFILDTIERYKL